jgi:prepilin-type N-terminal cleavage/methylation domain-containing protein
MLNIKNKNKNGFSLVEVLVALTILTVGLVSVSNLMVLNIQGSISDRDQNIASMLGQEAVELVQNIKDTNKVKGEVDQFKYLNDANNCRISYSFSYGQNLECAGVAASYYKLNFINGAGYTHAAGSATKFYRKLVISTSGGNKYASVYVSWNGTGIPASCNLKNKCMVIDAILANN